MRILIWLKRLFSPAKKTQFHPWRLRPELDLFTFRGDDNNVARMRNLFRDDFFQQVLIVLHNNRPRGFPVRGQKLTDLELAVEMGRIEGYESVLTLLEVMTTGNLKQEELRATWEDPDETAIEAGPNGMPPV